MALRGPWLLSRGLLRYRLITLAGVSAADRHGALQAQLAAWQPFPESLYLVDLSDDQAQVFALDQRQLPPQALSQAKTLWPESLLRESPVEGLRLIKGLEGFEGQAWRNGVLQASRWWTEVPAQEEWQAFARQARVADAALPQPLEPAWLKPLRPVLRADQLGRAGQGQERLIAGACALVLVTFSAAVAREAWDSYQASKAAAQELVSLKQEVAPLLGARERALAATDQSAMLLKQLDLPVPLELMDQLAQLLPKGVRVKELDLQPGSLKVALELPADVARARIVNELESGGWFVQVSEVKDAVSRNWVSFEMKLAGARPPNKQSNDAGLVRGAAERPAGPPPMPELQPQQGPKPAGSRT